MTEPSTRTDAVTEQQDTQHSAVTDPEILDQSGNLDQASTAPTDASVDGTDGAAVVDADLAESAEPVPVHGDVDSTGGTEGIDHVDPASDVGAEARGDDAGTEAPDDDTDGSDAEDAPISGEALLVQEGEIAGDYLEQLLDILDYDGDIDLDVEGSRAVVAIVGANDLDPLVGARGVTLDALQELTRLAVAQQTGVRTRLMLDVGGYRAGRRTELSGLAATNVASVIDTGETVRMAPMNAFERKIVHDVVTATDGVRSESEGEDPDRRVVILPDR